MHRRISILIFFIFLIFLFAETSIANSESLGSVRPIVIVPDDTDDIQHAIDLLPELGGTVFIRAGTYIISQGIHINRSNVTVMGEQGTLIKLGSQVKQPVMLIGTDKRDAEANDVIESIRLSNLEIGGNMSNQGNIFSEFDPSRCLNPYDLTEQNCWIRKNGIDIRAVKKLWIENVDVHHNPSGGIVVSLGSENIFISNSLSHHNLYDGIGLYDSEGIHVSNVSSYKNGKAGISLDNKLADVVFNGGIIKNNGDVGIFVRNAQNIYFNNLLIDSNTNYGAYLSHVTQGKNTGVKRVSFNGCSILNHRRYGIWLDSTSSDSIDNAVISCYFMRNKLGCIKIIQGGIMHQASNVCQLYN